MKSVCIKTNNKTDINCLLKQLNQTNIENICYTNKNFKNYKNIIIHYTGNKANSFISQIAEILSLIVIQNYEETLLKRLILSNYFYFDNQERKIVLEISLEHLYEQAISEINNRQQILTKIFCNYLSNNKSIILEGFINFRLTEYLEYLNTIVDTAVNQYIVEREYLEFISLLKIYINSEESTSECVHLIYNNEQSVLLDENRNIIEYNEDALKTQYLSDISFSSNDYTLNTLLNILPEKIYVYLSNEPIDEFINTLMLIFEKRVIFCETETRIKRK